MRTWFRASLPLAAAVALAACGDTPEPSPATPTVPEVGFARVPATCSTADLARLVRSYFSNPEQREASETLQAMEAACASEPVPDVTAAVNGGWHVLTLVERVLENGTGGSAADGAALANALTAWMCVQQPSLCAQPPAPVTAADLGPRGIFAVRSGGFDPVLARGKVPFKDDLEEDYLALWGIATTSGWSGVAANGEATLLFYGAPALPASLTLDEASIGDLAYGLNTFPDVPRFNDGSLHVAACYDGPSAEGPTLPHPGGDQTQDVWERMQREGTILQPFTPPCAAWEAAFATPSVAASLTGGLRRFAAWAFQPQPLFAAFFSDRRAGSVGGTPIDFSTFATVSANVDGYLRFVTQPTNGTAGQPLSPVRIQALSGNGTPMELVTIQLYVAGNQGEPAGALFCETEPGVPTGDDCSDTAVTLEALDGDGDGTLAVFDQAILYKAGGYRICARALASDGQPDFSFAEACSDLFNLKNGN